MAGVEAGLDDQAGGGGEQEDGHAHRCRRHAGHRFVPPVVRVYVLWGGEGQTLRTETTFSMSVAALSDELT